METDMFDLDRNAGRIAGAAFALMLSALFMATAILPASPTGLLA